ncbi:unnamed protein product [Pleuronectes platessa]|uniref:Uncharacterized protein n=1 Tax=Pleuronectes platessa TaxID=8262 RepID=A0A9N7YNE5_PLEPL|nr:unnamed protein product [Pleuronectes platessa]
MSEHDERLSGDAAVFMMEITDVLSNDEKKIYQGLSIDCSQIRCVNQRLGILTPTITQASSQATAVREPVSEDLRMFEGKRSGRSSEQLPAPESIPPDKPRTAGTTTPSRFPTCASEDLTLIHMHGTGQSDAVVATGSRAQGHRFSQRPSGHFPKVCT